jgi:hypothetical protein
VIKRHYLDRPPIQIISAEGDTHQAKRSINAISKAYSPMGSSIYHERIIILCDKPTVKAKGGFDQFIEAHKPIYKRGQILILPHGSLEECYPTENLLGHQKKQLAKNVGDNISKESFEANMPLLFEALSKAWVNAF